MLLLNSTVDELDPVFQLYCMFWPDTTLVVISDTVPLQALPGEFTNPTVLAGGALLTTNTAEPLDVPAGQFASVSDVTV
jgi:hypothetical protein